MTNEEMTKTNKKNILDALRAAGIKRVTVAYSGGGDSGQMDDLHCEDSAGQSTACPTTVVRLITSHYHWDKDDSKDGYQFTESDRSLAEAIEYFFYQILHDLHGGWENNAGGEGELIIDVPGDLATLEHYQRYEEYTKHTNEI